MAAVEGDLIVVLLTIPARAMHFTLGNLDANSRLLSYRL